MNFLVRVSVRVSVHGYGWVIKNGVSVAIQGESLGSSWVSVMYGSRMTPA